ncbi:hypothetical protein MPL3365_450022 [Mesorhizobium plurifarium]|uniref:Uncharacterized protein n=1 Tax=Mesorhizobium plurifarium TaxID=69974 RepID=A0A090GA97_MESPL|nr:hypothetical protein MPL3365_450022 [Mesorhizobium plurifarium]
MDRAGDVGRRQTARAFEAHLVASVRFRLVEMLVGDLEHVVVGGWTPEGDAADADRERPWLAAGRKLGFADAQPDRFRDQEGARRVGARQEDREFLAADAADNVGAAQLPLDRAGDQLQRLVAAVMAETVVDRFEMVGIDDQQRAGIGDVMAACLVEIGLHQHREGAAIEDGRQAVGRRDNAELLLGDRELAHLPHQEEQEGATKDERQEQVRELRPQQRLRRQRREIEGIDEERGGNEKGSAGGGNHHDPAPTRRGQIDAHGIAPTAIGSIVQRERKRSPNTLASMQVWLTGRSIRPRWGQAESPPPKAAGSPTGRRFLVSAPPAAAGDAVGRRAARPVRHSRWLLPCDSKSTARNHQAEHPEILVIRSFAGEHVGATLLHPGQFRAGHLSHRTLHDSTVRSPESVRRAQGREPSDGDACIITDAETKDRVGGIADIRAKIRVNAAGAADRRCGVRVDTAPSARRCGRAGVHAIRPADGRAKTGINAIATAD